MDNLALLTDLYELTMLQGYHCYKPEQEAVFNMFYRRQPFDGGFALFVGIEPLLEAILNLRFTDDDLGYLDSTGLFRADFLDYLKDFKFSGDIYAAREGSVVFPNEPLFRIHGSMMETQLLETLTLNFLNFQSLIATKAARIVLEAGDAAVLDFGLRRAQGRDGALSAARAAFIGGVAGTSNVLAGKMFGIPIKGTMAHSWVMSANSELEAFENYAEMYPNNCTLLVDTFDTLRSGIPNAISVFQKLKERGVKSYGIRLDSGDLEYLSREGRKMLDRCGLPDAKIFVSNELDEWVINQLMANKLPIDGWGVGTKLVTGDRDPALTGVYKIVAQKNGAAFEPCIKISNNPEKVSFPGVTNVCRFLDEDGNMLADMVHLEDEKEELIRRIEKKEAVYFNHPSIAYSHFRLDRFASFRELLVPMVRDGKRSYRFPSILETQKFAREELSRLHSTYKRLLNPHIYKVSHSNALRDLKKRLIDKYAK